MTCRPRMRPHVPGRLLLTLRLGEMPEHLPGLRAVVGIRNAAQADHVDGGVDRSAAASSRRRVRARCACTARARAAMNAGGRRAPLRRRRAVERRRARAAHRSAAIATLRARCCSRSRELPMVERVQRRPPLPHAVRRRRAGTQRAPTTAATWRARADPSAAGARASSRGDPAVVIGLADTGVAHGPRGARLRRAAPASTASTSTRTTVGDAQAGRRLPPCRRTSRRRSRPWHRLRRHPGGATGATCRRAAQAPAA